MKKRTMALLLCLALGCCLVACDMQLGGLVGELFVTEEMEGDPLPEDVQPDYVLPDIWFETEVEIGGDDVIVDLPVDTYAGRSVVVLGSLAYDLGISGDAPDNLVERTTYQRNQQVQAERGIVIEGKLLSWAQIKDEVTASVQSGSMDYDIVLAGISANGSELMLNGSLQNLHNLPYLDLHSGAWDEGVSQGLAIGEYLPMATGEIVPSSDLSTSLLVFNREMAAEYGIEMYDYVLTGGWTMEKMNAIINEFYVDLNGDSVLDVEDQFGLVMDAEQVNAFACGADAMWIGKDDRNLPVSNADGNLERLVRAYDQFYHMMQERGVYCNEADSPNSSSYVSVFSIFERGNAFIYATNYETVLLDLFATERTYGILPYPKLDMEQENYRSLVSTAANAVMVPVSVSDPALVGYTLEAMAQASDGLYDSILPMRACYSEQDKDMLMLVLDSKTLDFGSNYLLRLPGSPVQYFRNALKQDASSFTVFLAQYERWVAENLENLVAQLPYGN